MNFEKPVRWGEQLRGLNPTAATYASQFVEFVLAAARQSRASDVHLQPTADGLQVRWRMDGVLQTVGVFPNGSTSDIVARLKVLAELLTYHTDIPQEGRIRTESRAGSGGVPTGDVEMRVSTFPTLFGERAVIRLFATHGQLLQIHELGWPVELTEAVGRLLNHTSGALLITGSAGSGKTTSAYACLRHVVAMHDHARNVVSLEDPIEVAVPGVAQSQVNASAGFDLHSGLKSLLRQDPEVIFVGEIRDRVTAAVAFQAALTGQLVLSTFHAGSAAEAISRLSDMGIESYSLRSGLLGILSQRLVRRLCTCAITTSSTADFLGFPVTAARLPAGCEACRGTGYKGRAVLAELLVAHRHEIGQAILAREEAARIEQLAIEAGMVPLRTRAAQAIQEGITSPAEIHRVLGVS